MTPTFLETRKFRLLFCLAFVWCLESLQGQESSSRRYSTSDNHSGYVHWIDLYDASNLKIDPTAENPQPYSPKNTCGRCHDFQTISHGWHFNALDADADHGRQGQPWIWSDGRTGTHLPLSYRKWDGTFNPDEIGLSRWQVAEKLGGFMPGGGVGSSEHLNPNQEAVAVDATPASKQGDKPQKPPTADASESAPGFVDRSHITGELPVDCMLCHRNSGSGYSPFVWTEQIENQNFAYAPTAAMGLGVVSGVMRRLKDDFDIEAEGAEDRLPKVEYEANRFRSDGKVFFDLVRKPTSDACYYCHTNVDAEAVLGQRWLHDEDVHLRAGLACADCHRNGLEHDTIRGFVGEQHSAGSLAATFSCQGCHMPDDSHHGTGATSEEKFELPGRMGAPKPLHKGLPPIHFEKLSCTSCHSGPLPSEWAGRQMNSIAHQLGKHVKRDGKESPAIFAGVQLVSSNEESTGIYTPHRMMWPSYWGIIRGDEVQPLNPELVYDLIRKPLKVRRDFTTELAKVKLKLSVRKELLGDERYRVKEEDRTDEEQAAIAAAESELRTKQINEKMAAALAAIEKSYPETQAVYISGGDGFVRDGDSAITKLDPERLGDAALPYTWPLAHNVRPARQSLGASGCLECHGQEPLFFTTQIKPVGMLPDQETQTVVAHELQCADMNRLALWSQMFAGRSNFKVIGFGALGLTCFIALFALSYNVGRTRGSRGDSSDA